MSEHQEAPPDAEGDGLGHSGHECSGSEEIRSDCWQTYRALVLAEHVECRSRIPAIVRERLDCGDAADPEVYAAGTELFGRYAALAPLFVAGSGGPDLVQEATRLLADYQTLRDQRCKPGTGDWASLQSRCASLMTNLARLAIRQGRMEEARPWFLQAAEAWRAIDDRLRVEECLLAAAEASFTVDHDVDAMLQALEAWLSGRSPVRRAALLARVARSC
jgi:hypothetical protein